MCKLCVCWCPQRPEEGLRSPETRVADRCEPSDTDAKKAAERRDFKMYSEMLVIMYKDTQGIKRKVCLSYRIFTVGEIYILNNHIEINNLRNREIESIVSRSWRHSSIGKVSAVHASIEVQNPRTHTKACSSSMYATPALR